MASQTVGNKVKEVSKEWQAALLNDEEFLRNILEQALQRLLDTEFESFIGVAPYERHERRKGYRNGSRARSLYTRVGRIELQLPRDREGKFSTELFSRYQRSERALVLALAEAYFEGVSTRKISAIMEQLCGESFSRSTISNFAKDLDSLLDEWRHRELEKEYPYLLVDARFESIREDGLVKKKAVLLVMGIDSEGYRELLGLEISYTESEVNWLEFFRSLKARGLKGVRYIVSDDHEGLRSAIIRSFPGVQWQRCQVHFIRNFMSKFSRKEVGEYLGWLKEVFHAPELEEAHRRCQLLIEKLQEAGKEKIAEWLEEEIAHCLSVYALPKEHRRRMRSTNMLERFNQELKRRTRVIRIFPNDRSCLRLVGALCMEQSEEWQTGRKYLNMKVHEVQPGRVKKKPRVAPVV